VSRAEILQPLLAPAGPSGSTLDSLTANLTATALNGQPQCERQRTSISMIYNGFDVGGRVSSHLSRRERGFDSRWDHQGNQALIPSDDLRASRKLRHQVVEQLGTETPTCRIYLHRPNIRDKRGHGRT
jgi:hypothetical protein